MVPEVLTALGLAWQAFMTVNIPARLVDPQDRAFVIVVKFAMLTSLIFSILMCTPDSFVMRRVVGDSQDSQDAHDARANYFFVACMGLFLGGVWSLDPTILCQPAPTRLQPGEARSSASISACIVETVLSVIVCAYAVAYLLAIDDTTVHWRGLFLAMFGVLVLSAETLGGVDRLKWNVDQKHYLGCLRFETDCTLSIPDGVDPFEYTDMISAVSVSNGLVVSSVTSLAIRLALDSSSVSRVVACLCCFVSVAVIAVCSSVAIESSPELASFFRSLNEPFYTRPQCRPVRAALLAGGASYALFLLFLVPGPSKVRWSLALTHSTRLLHVLVALGRQGQGVADAAVEIVAGDVVPPIVDHLPQGEI